MEQKNQPQNPFFPVQLPHPLTTPSGFLQPWPPAASGSLFLHQPMVVGPSQIHSSVPQSLQRVKSPESTKHQYESDDDDASSDGGGGYRKRNRRDDDANSVGEEDRTKKRREQIAAASRASRARRKRELEDLRAETKQLKEEKELLQDNVRRMQKRIEDLQERSIKSQEASKRTETSLPSNLILDLSKSLVAVVALLTGIRDKTCSPTDYVRYSNRLCRILAEEGLAHCRLMQPTTVMTPTEAEAHGLAYPDFGRECCVVSIMRSGDIIADSIREIIPSMPVGKLLIQRQEQTKEKSAVLYWSKLPHDIANRFVFVCDPMLGTGGSICLCLQELVKQHVNPKNTIFLNIVSCPEGLSRLNREFPEVKVITCAVDDALNDNCYIVPGLGDYGDRFYHTTHS